MECDEQTNKKEGVFRPYMKNGTIWELIRVDVGWYATPEHRGKLEAYRKKMIKQYSGERRYPR